MKFCDLWLLERPFDADVKSVRTCWSIGSGRGHLWVKDDWRTMVTILRSDIETWKNHWKDDCPVNLNDWQRRVLVEQVDLVLEDTEDWQLPADEFQKAIQSWIDILKGLNADERVDYWINEYKTICELS